MRDLVVCGCGQGVPVCFKGFALCAMRICQLPHSPKAMEGLLNAHAGCSFPRSSASELLVVWIRLPTVPIAPMYTYSCPRDLDVVWCLSVCLGGLTVVSDAS